MAVTSGTDWQVAAGTSFTAALVDPPGELQNLGVRIETPVSAAIVAYWRAATLLGGLWTASIESPVSPGGYQLAWMTGDEPPSFRVLVPLFVVADLEATGLPAVDYPDVDLQEITPSVSDVAILERTRTVDAGGNEVSTFTDTTTPTAIDAEAIIDQAVSDITAQLRPKFDPAHYPQVKRTIAFYAAAMIENSFYRDQQQPTGGPWRADYQEALKALQERIEADLTQTLLLGGMEPRRPYTPYTGLA